MLDGVVLDVGGKAKSKGLAAEPVNGGAAFGDRLVAKSPKPTTQSWRDGAPLGENDVNGPSELTKRDRSRGMNAGDDAEVVSPVVGTELWLTRVIAGEGELPSLLAVQRAAVAALGPWAVEPEMDFFRRARMSGIVPRLDARVGTDADQDVRDVELGRLSRTRTEGRAFGFEIAARWNLADLVFHNAELRALRVEMARSAAVHLARDRATKLYFRRLSILLRMKNKATDALRLEAARLDGLLRSVTGGRLERRGSR